MAQDREEFASHRRKILESADSVIGPAVRPCPEALRQSLVVRADPRRGRADLPPCVPGRDRHQQARRPDRRGAAVVRFRTQLQSCPASDSVVWTMAPSRESTRWVSTAATNAGTHFATQTTDIQGSHEWVTMHDSKVRVAHEHTDGQKQPYTGRGSKSARTRDGQFVVSMRYPGDPRAPISFWIHCRCVLRPVASSSATGRNRDRSAWTSFTIRSFRRAHRLREQLELGRFRGMGLW